LKASYSDFGEFLKVRFLGFAHGAKSGPQVRLGRLTIISSHLLAQNPLSIYPGRFLKAKLYRTFDFSTPLYRYPEIMIGKNLDPILSEKN